MASLSEEFQRTWLTSIIGLIIFFGGAYLLTWNEGRAVRHHHSLEEAYKDAISLNPYDKVRPEFEGRVVHIAGDLIVDEPLTEPEYGISVQAVKLKRRVQMYQWVEERAPRGEDSGHVIQERSENDYYYVTEWRDKLVDSSSFYIRHGHQNPTEMPLTTVTYVAPYVRVGNLVLSREVKEKFSDFTEMTSDERPDRKDIKLHMGIYYHCQDIWNPEIGDIRVQFYIAGMAGESMTVVAKQKNGVLVPYETSKGHKIALLRYGNLNIPQIFNAEHSDVRVETWKLRFYGCAFIYFSTVCLSRLMKILFSQVPYLVNVISGEAVDFNNFLVAASVSLLIVSISWMACRPVIGVSLLLAAISPFLYCTLAVYNATQNEFNIRS